MGTECLESGLSGLDYAMKCIEDGHHQEARIELMLKKATVLSKMFDANEKKKKRGSEIIIP